jgi:predicted nucleic acid-binding protein
VRTHVLDASALYRYLTDEPGAAIVAEVLKSASSANAAVIMSVMNWGEVYYTLVKRIGLAQAEKLMLEVMEQVPLSLVPVAQSDAESAARLKARYNLPYADAFAAALTGSQHVLVTADVEHFSRVPKWRLLKLPRAKHTQN